MERLREKAEAERKRAEETAARMEKELRLAHSEQTARFSVLFEDIAEKMNQALALLAEKCRRAKGYGAKNGQCSTHSAERGVKTDSGRCRAGMTCENCLLYGGACGMIGIRAAIGAVRGRRTNKSRTNFMGGGKQWIGNTVKSTRKKALTVAIIYGHKSNTEPE